MTPELLQADMASLMERVEFRRFLWRMIERGGLLSVATSGADDRDLNFAEGRRSIALETLSEVEAAAPEKHPSGYPLLCLIQTISQEVQTPQRSMEKSRGRRSRNDHYRDLRDDGDSDDPE